MSCFTVGLVQLTATRSISENIDIAAGLIRQAASAGADVIATPEVTSLMERRSAASLAQCQSQDDDAALKAFQALAGELGKTLFIGSLPIKLSDTQLANRSFVIDPSGAVRATYDKIHMFDVDLPNGEAIRESKTYRPGDKAVVVDLPEARFGLSICYDLRFAYLYRALAQAGAQVLMVPAAFTQITGEAHWHTLLQARAIETGAFVVAAGQCGSHEDGRQTYGHSLVVAPWGEIMADGGAEPGVTLAEIDLSRVDKARGQVPALAHDMPFDLIHTK
ncbi:MAG: carbon-nitrogen hydrolase family protein [Alphaproteobacteria bacterium]